jgi:hypothetical protein
MRQHNFLFKAVIVLAAGLFIIDLAMSNDTPAITRSFTLSDEDLMLLDWHFGSYSSSTVINKTDVPGPGVEFTIRFPDNTSKNYSITYVSCKSGSDGLLTGIDINDFDAFALKFTLLSVNDSNAPDAGGSLVVGALINMGYSWGYRPEVISLQPQRNTAVSLTATDANNISIIGFTAHFFEPQGWDPNGSTVKLLVEPAPNAEVLP